MARGPDHPHDLSSRFPKSKRDAIYALRARDDVSGNVVAPSGDVTVEAVGRQVTSGARDLKTVLAYLDVIDVQSEERHTDTALVLSVAQREISDLRAQVAEQTGLLREVVAFLGVVVPAWESLEEVNNGDDMGMARPSVADLGLTMELVPLQQEPGYEHEELVRTEPPAGALVARGSMIRVFVNYLG